MLIMYFMKINISKILLFQHAINVKTTEIFNIIYTESSKIQCVPCFF